MQPMHIALVVLALAATCATGQAHAQSELRELRPSDQAWARADFAAFRAGLQGTIARRDATALLAAVHRDVMNSFGGDNGVEQFKRSWALDRADSRLWETLATVLALGGSFDAQGRFSAPYVYSRWPDALDAHSFAAIVASGEPVRTEPKPGAATVSRLSFAIVELARPIGANDAWVALRLPGGSTGHVRREALRSPLDYRAVFEKSGGRWRLSALLAGD